MRRRYTLKAWPSVTRVRIQEVARRVAVVCDKTLAEDRSAALVRVVVTTRKIVDNADGTGERSDSQSLGELLCLATHTGTRKRNNRTRIDEVNDSTAGGIKTAWL